MCSTGGRPLPGGGCATTMAAPGQWLASTSVSVWPGERTGRKGQEAGEHRKSQWRQVGMPPSAMR